MRPAMILVGLAVLLAASTSVTAAQPGVVVGPGRFDWNRMARLPREEAIALALRPEYESVRPGVLSLVFRMWAREDPAAAHWRLSRLDEEVDVSLIEPQIVEAWLAVDPSAAMNAALASDHPQTLNMALRRYGDIDPVAALDFARAHPTRVSGADWTGLLEGVASRHPGIAADHVAAVGDADLIDTFFIGYARQDPAAAMDWLGTHFPAETEPYESVATVFFIADPAAAFAYLDAMPPSAARDVYRVSLCTAEEVNRDSRAASALPQQPYDATRCRR